MKQLLLAVFLLVAMNIHAQERIDTDRPDQTESVFTIPLHYFQGELGFGQERFKDRNYRLLHPAFLFKYGIAKKIEFRVEGNLLSDYLQVRPAGTKNIGFEPLEVGAKFQLVEEKGIRPKTSLIVHLGLPFTGSDYDREQNVYPSFRFLFQHSLTEKIALGYNLGAEWDGYSSRPTFTYTFSPNINIGKRWYAYIEAFGFVRGQYSEHLLDGGFAYYISNDVKVDLSAGAGLGASPLRHYASLGFSFRVPLRQHSVNGSLLSLNSKFPR